MKTQYNKECPCGKQVIKIALDEEVDELYCPICTISLSEETDTLFEIEEDFEE